MPLEKMSPEKIASSNQPADISARTYTSSALRKTSALALLGDGLVCIIEAVVAYTTVGISLMGLMPLLILALVAIITALLTLRRVRGALTANIVLGFLTFTYLIVPATRSGLLQPTTSVSHFSLLVLIFAFALIAIVAGIAARIQGTRRPAPAAERWLPVFLGVISGLVAGMILVASLIGSAPQSSTATATTNGMPTVHTEGARFLTNVVLVPKGQSLLIIDDDGELHIIANGSWANGTPQPQAEPGSPLVNQFNLQSGSKVIGPFNTAGVFHLYCTIHLNMNLTVVVQ